jgi:hypothetical protein
MTYPNAPSAGAFLMTAGSSRAEMKKIRASGCASRMLQAAGQQQQAPWVGSEYVARPEH